MFYCGHAAITANLGSVDLPEWIKKDLRSALIMREMYKCCVCNSRYDWADLKSDYKRESNMKKTAAPARWRRDTFFTEVKLKLKQSEYTVINPSGIFSVWAFFMQIVDKDKMKVSAINCIMCGGLLQYDSIKTGT